MHLFYAEELNPKKGFLNKDESHHVSRVLRLNEGDKILVTQGKGIIYKATISLMNKAQVQFLVQETHSATAQKNYLHIAVAPTKSLDRFETFLEKATEMGIDEITPILSFHSERKVYKLDRGLKIIKAASKQSLSCWLPKLNPLTPLSEFINNVHTESAYIAHCEDNKERFDILPKLSTIPHITMLIGPEGDFSSTEIEMALQQGFKAASLGSKRLRTETAAMAVTMAAKLL